MTQAAYRNLGPDLKRDKKENPHFWTVEVLTATGEWFHFEGVYARSRVEMEKRAAELAERYIVFTPKPKEVREKEHAAFMRDISIWGCE